MASYIKPEWWDEWIIDDKVPARIREDAPEWVKKEFKKMTDEIQKLNSPIKE